MARATPRRVVNGTFWQAASAMAVSASAARSSASRAHDGVSDSPAWMARVAPPEGVALLPGIKLTVMIARRQDISSDQFHDYWLSSHAALALSIADEVRLRRYVQTHEVPSAAGVAFADARGWTPNIFEGVTEGWWDSEADLADAFSTPAGQAILGRLIEDERKFCDARTMAMISREYLIFDRDRAA